MVHLIQLISCRTLSKIMITESGELKDSDHESGLYFSGFIASKDLRSTFIKGYAKMSKRQIGEKTSKVTGRKIPVYTYEKTGQITGYTALAKNLNLIAFMDSATLKRKLKPFIEKGVSPIYCFTKCASLGLSDHYLNGNEKAYGFTRNEWMFSASPPAVDFSYVNERLRKLGSPFRVRVKDIHLTRVANPKYFGKRRLW